MAAASNKKMLIGGIAVVVLLVLGVIAGFSFSSGEQQSSSPARPVARDADAEYDSAPVATRDAPGKEARTSGRLTGSSDQMVSGDAGQDQTALKEKKKRAPKRRKGRKKRTETEEEEPAAKKGAKGEGIPKPF